MKTATVKELKTELSTRSQDELIALCLNLSKFKKENKELLTYLVYEANDENAYIQSVNTEIEAEFQDINTSKVFFIKKSVRKILRICKKYIRYSKKKETEIEILLHFCALMQAKKPNILKDTSMSALYEKQKDSIRKAILFLHEDLQFDYQTLLDKLK